MADILNVVEITTLWEADAAKVPLFITKGVKVKLLAPAEKTLIVAGLVAKLIALMPELIIETETV